MNRAVYRLLSRAGLSLSIVLSGCNLLPTAVAPSQAAAPANVQPLPASVNLREYIQRTNPNLSPSQLEQIANGITTYSAHHGLPAQLVAAVIARESSFNPQATSPSGAMGLGQIMPTLASDLALSNPYDIDQNIEGTTRWLRRLYDVWRRDGLSSSDALTWALASYRQGLTRTREVGIPAFVADYINSIYDLARQLPA